MSAGSKILWSEGLTLAPQHLQRQDHYHEMRLQRMVAALNPHLWGLRSVQWNHDALAHNRLCADALSVIFPDGEIYDAPDADLLPDQVELDRLPPQAQTFTFQAALPPVRPHGGNADENGRYVRCEAETPDLFSEALPTEVLYLKKQAILAAQPAAGHTHTSVPVVRIRRAAPGGFEIDPSFVPPCVAIGATPTPMRMLDGLISALTAKIEALQRMHRKGRNGAYEVASGDISSWWMLNIVSTANALLAHCARSPGLHPEVLYEKLLATAGGLMTFSDRHATADLPAYRHDALGEVFGALEAVLRELVDTVISAKHFVIPLVADGKRPAFHQAVLDPAKVTPETQLCLAVSADMPPLELVAAVPVRLKLGAPEDLERIVGSALSGLPLTHLPQVPAAVPVRPDTYYFAVSTKGTLYENALKANALGVYAPDGMPGLKIALIAFV